MRNRRAFTLVELLVVIGIIAILIGILIPVVGKMRVRAHVADTANMISVVQGAIERYHNDFGAYPGVFKNDEIYNNSPSTVNVATITFNAPSPAPAGFDPTPPTQAKITMGENLVLSLFGGLRADNSTPPKLVYDPSAVGLGPVNLGNLSSAGISPKRYEPYLQDTKQLSWRDSAAGKTGHFQDDSGSADDTVIPELLDRFPAGMPLIYLRAKAGAPSISPTATGFGSSHNSICTDNNYSPPSGARFREGQYDVSQFVAYTGPDASGHFIGEGKSVRSGDYKNATPPAHGLQATIDINSSLDKNAAAPAKYYYPYDAYAYFTNPSIPNTARAKDGYILISAGADRVYGTNDDITTFGDVAP